MRKKREWSILAAEVSPMMSGWKSTALPGWWIFCCAEIKHGSHNHKVGILLMDTITVCEDQGIITISKGSFYSQCLIFLQLHLLWLWDKWVLGEKGAYNWEKEKETERMPDETHPKSADVDCCDSVPRVYGQGLCMVGISRRPEVTQLRVSFRALLRWPRFEESSPNMLSKVALSPSLSDPLPSWRFPHVTPARLKL